MWQSNPLRLILLALAVELHSCGGSPPAVFSLTHDLYEEGVKGLMTLVRLEVTTGTEHIVANLTDPVRLLRTRYPTCLLGIVNNT